MFLVKKDSNPVCPIMQTLHQKGEFLRSNVHCDRAQFRKFLPKHFWLFSKPCHWKNRCLITVETMGESLNIDDEPVNPTILKRNIARYCKTHNVHSKKSFFAEIMIKILNKIILWMKPKQKKKFSQKEVYEK